MAIDVMHRRGISLRWLMVLIVLLAALPIFALHISRIQARSEATVQRAYDHAEALAASGAAAHERIITQAQRLLELLSHIPAVRTGALPECEEILRSVREGRDWLKTIFVTNENGLSRCVGGEAAKSVDIGDREYFSRARRTGEPQISDVVTGRISGERVIVALTPLKSGNGAFAGGLVVSVSLNWMNVVAAEAGAKFDGLLMVFDKSGSLVAYRANGEPDADLAALSGNEQVKAVFTSTARTFEGADPRGVQRLFSVKRLPDSGITVAVGLDRAEVLDPIDKSFLRDLLFLFSVTIGSIGLAWLAAEVGLMRGVRALKTASQRLKAGKMGLRVRLPTFVASELHDLAATYNSMTAEFERLAYLDRLTGLPNRRYLERHMTKRNERGEQVAPGRQAVLAIDIDGFKPVNDTHGHAVGDRVLALIARRIADALDERGLLFRVGGDEFVTVAPVSKSPGRDVARLIAEDIRQALEQAIELDGFTFPVACSIGIAMVPEDAKTLSGALVLADAALYEAKRSGRNRVIDSAPPLAAGMPGGEPRVQPFGASRTGAATS